MNKIITILSAGLACILVSCDGSSRTTTTTKTTTTETTQASNSEKGKVSYKDTLVVNNGMVTQDETSSTRSYDADASSSNNKKSRSVTDETKSSSH